MPYRKFFISEEAWPDTTVLPLPDDFPDPRIVTEYLETPGALVVIENGDVGERAAKEALTAHVEDIKAHLGKVGCLLENGTVVWGKVVPCRVSVSALVEWLADGRDKNRGVYPDRPPDMDSDTLRSWIEHPVEIGDGVHIAGSAATPSDVSERFPVYSCTVTRMDDSVAKVLISWWAYSSIKADELPEPLAYRRNAPNGAYLVRVKTEETGTNPVVDIEAMVDDEDPGVWDKVEALLQISAALAKAGTEPVISTYEDYRDIIDQGDLAVAEMNAYYQAEMLRRPGRSLSRTPPPN
jgi:hypothetical protein